MIHWWNARGMNLVPGSNMPWFAEGVTTYLEHLMLLRAGLTDLDFFAQSVVDDWFRSRPQSPDRNQWTLEQASAQFGASSAAREIVYHRGAAAAFVLDMSLRQKSSQLLSIEDVVATLVRRGHQGGGTRSRDIPAMFAELGGADLMATFAECLTTLPGPQLEPALAAMGYRLVAGERAYLGVRFAAGDRFLVSFVQADGPSAGVIRRGDELLAMAGAEVSEFVELEQRLGELEPGATVAVRLRRRDRVLERELKLGSRPTLSAVSEPVNSPVVKAMRHALQNALKNRTSERLPETTQAESTESSR